MDARRAPQQASVGRGVAPPQSAQGRPVIPLSITSNPPADGINPEERDEMKRATKLAYFAAALSGASLMAILSHYLGEQTGRSLSYLVMLCIMLLMASFVSAVILMLMACFKDLRFKSHLRLVIASALLAMPLPILASIMALLALLQGYATLTVASPLIVVGAIYAFYRVFGGDAS